ncbi:hypothetical protein DPMN_047851 [Dreissena polymorpha]|uniref:Uncharacterized protein n=1 Tax=Dreissena polymorpha TaxID=45954 RepID=A0A9D4DAH1_DREPO|nr:hypothetical protein DPMN_047851 [Dreissena polymorpha]
MRDGGQKTMVKSNTSADISMNGKKLEEVTILGATLSKDGTSTAEVQMRISVSPARIYSKC